MAFDLDEALEILKNQKPRPDFVIVPPTRCNLCGQLLASLIFPTKIVYGKRVHKECQYK